MLAAAAAGGAGPGTGSARSIAYSAGTRPPYWCRAEYSRPAVVNAELRTTLLSSLHRHAVR